MGKKAREGVGWGEREESIKISVSKGSYLFLPQDGTSRTKKKKTDVKVWMKSVSRWNRNESFCCKELTWLERREENDRKDLFFLSDHEIRFDWGLKLFFLLWYSRVFSCQWGWTEARGCQPLQFWTAPSSLHKRPSSISKILMLSYGPNLRPLGPPRPKEALIRVTT